jgi:hypothetical protein
MEPFAADAGPPSLEAPNAIVVESQSLLSLMGGVLPPPSSSSLSSSVASKRLSDDHDNDDHDYHDHLNRNGENDHDHDNNVNVNVTDEKEDVGMKTYAKLVFCPGGGTSGSVQYITQLVGWIFIRSFHSFFSALSFH